jgi:hypothetical protein
MTLQTLRNNFYDGSATGTALNWVFPIDTSTFWKTKAERLGFDA